MDGMSLLDVLRGVMLDPAEQAAYNADPSAYLVHHGYGQVDPADVREAFGLVADTLPPAQAHAAWAAAGTGPFGGLGDHDLDGHPDHPVFDAADLDAHDVAAHHLDPDHQGHDPWATGVGHAPGLSFGLGEAADDGLIDHHGGPLTSAFAEHDNLFGAGSGDHGVDRSGLVDDPAGHHAGDPLDHDHPFAGFGDDHHGGLDDHHVPDHDGLDHHGLDDHGLDHHAGWVDDHHGGLDDHGGLGEHAEGLFEHDGLHPGHEALDDGFGNLDDLDQSHHHHDPGDVGHF